MNRRFTVSVLAAACSSAAFAGPFTANDARTAAMGGAGVASADPAASISLNPSLMAGYPESERFNMILPSVGGYIEDPEGLIETVVNFSEDDLPRYEDFEDEGLDELNDAVQNLEAQATALQTAATAFGVAAADANADLTTPYNNLQAQQQALTEAIRDVREEVNGLNSLVSDTRDSFNSFSGKPMQAGVIAHASIAVPSSRWNWGIMANNNTFAGAELNLLGSDLGAADYALLSADEYLIEVEALSAQTEVVLQEAEDVRDTTGADRLAASGDFVRASNDFLTQADAVTDFTSQNSTGYGDAYGGGDPNYPVFNDPLFVDGEFEGLADVDEDQFDSSVHVVGVNVLEMGFGMGREFEYADETFYLGATLKYQYILITDAVIDYSDFEDDASDSIEETFEESTKDYSTVNIDLGASKDFNYKGTITTGLVIKDLIPQSFKSSEGTRIEFEPKVRAGASHKTKYSTLAADLDITENQPLAIGVPTRYLSLGAELNAWNWFKVRTGYRNNLSVADSSIVSLGFGFTPWGTGLDITAWAHPADEDEAMLKGAGVMMQLSTKF